MAEWISVKDRLPDVAGENNNNKTTNNVLAWAGDRIMYGHFTIYKYDGSWCFDGVDEEDVYEAYTAFDVTHWMPLPEPPEGE